MPAHCFEGRIGQGSTPINSKVEARLFREKNKDNLAIQMHAHHEIWPAARGLFNLLMKA